MRLIKCNSLDLNLFQIDWDLTFGVVFLNADRTVYARYGTRDSMKADDDVAIGGLQATMRAVLKLHENYPANKDRLASKQPNKSAESIPEEYSSLDHFKPSLDYQGAVAKSCIHCHQVRDAARVEFRNSGERMPDEVLFAFPSTRTIGVELDPQSIARVLAVTESSPAASSELRAGDEVRTVEGSEIASEADFRWLLHNLSGDDRTLDLEVERDGKVISVKVDLPIGWRKQMDMSWRPSSWDLRRMATGGMTLVGLSDEERVSLEIKDGQMALRAKHVGMYGHHARARRAGIRKGDVIVGFDGRNDLHSESAVFEQAIQKRKRGDIVTIDFLRNGHKKSAKLKLQ